MTEQRENNEPVLPYVIRPFGHGMTKQVFLDKNMSIFDQIDVATKTGCSCFVTTDGEMHMRNSPIIAPQITSPSQVASRTSSPVSWRST